jgi:probable addiction module antidote protein
MKNDLSVESLKDPEEALGHLNVTLKFNVESDFIFALYNVAIAQGGFNKLAEKTGFGRESLYKTLTPHNNPRFATIVTIIRALGYDLQLVPVNTIGSQSLKKPCSARLNSLVQKYPELAKQWHITRNDLTPNDFTAESRKFVWWKCPKNQSHEWQASCKRRLKEGCPFCRSCTKDVKKEEKTI